MPSVDPIPSPVPLLISRPEVSVAHESNAPVRRKVSRFEVITSPNVVATVISETGTQRPGESSQPSTITHPMSSDPLAVTRVTVEPDDSRVEVSRQNPL
jgi:chloride channel 2